MERYHLSIERIRQIIPAAEVLEPFLTYFKEMAAFICCLDEVFVLRTTKGMAGLTKEQLMGYQHKLYKDILPEHYEKSFANPAYAVRELGAGYGKLLSFLYSELRGGIACAYEGKLFDLTINNELFLEIYQMFIYEAQDERLPVEKEVQQVIISHINDYCGQLMENRLREQLEPSEDFAVKIIMESDLSTPDYLYLFGEYISDTTVQTAEFLNTLTEEEIAQLASTYTEGYRLGFINNNKDLTNKKTVNIRYCLGFERIVRQAVKNFEQMGLQPIIYRTANHAVNRRSNILTGYYGAIPNKQYDYDHKEDEAIYLDKAFLRKKLLALKNSYEKEKDLAGVHAGPAVIEIFGEEPFVPAPKEEACHLTPKQQKLAVEYAIEASEITNQYIKGEERSFTIIAFPVPEIGEQFPQIFKDTVKINTLDYRLYEQVQQHIIDTLSGARFVKIKGMNGNLTDLTVALYQPENQEKEAVFENCVADVNIPVGEIFTSPVLNGTNGKLFVSSVYLNELQYQNLEIDFKDGMIESYTCTNFSQAEENKKYIKDNILYHHDSLPMGEFAIGTNTTAYVMAKKFGIEDKLPILIAEKMGPHFAVGDTCYSHAEDLHIFNPDGKEIMAKDNAVSILRKSEPSQAYFGCHTDITIPYDELGELSGVYDDGIVIPIIREGRFVLEGCEVLNEPFQ